MSHSNLFTLRGSPSNVWRFLTITPGTYGVRVRETIEEIAGELLGVLGERHVRSGFEACVIGLSE